ncbi:MAG: tail tape measure protein core region [Xanthobacteraceae bacterium]|jgi:hypothetical protein|nr:tail tape measure protein core region [Xanthobacteraceae bacterium]
MAKGTVVGSLLAKLGIDAAEYEAGLDKADRDAQAWSKKFKSTMSTTASYVSAAAAGIKGAILGIGFAGATQAIRETVAAIASLGDEAKRSGLSLKAFQEWKFVAEQNRIGIDAMVDGFKELNLRADEFIATGGGSAADAFQRLGYSADDLKERLKDPSALMLDIIERLRQLDSAAQIRIFDELLGGSGGEQFVQLISQGADGIRKTIDRAHELGRVFTDEVVKGADDVNRKFNDVMGTLTTWSQTEVVKFARDIGQAYAELKGIYDLVQRMRDSYNPPDQQQNETIEARINTIMRDRLDLVSKIADAREKIANSDQIEVGIGDNAIAALQEKIDALNAQEAQLIKILNARQDGESSTPAAPVVPNITGPKTPLPPERPEEADKAYEAFLAKQQAETDAINARVQALREALMTEQEAEMASYETRIENLKTWLENRNITQAEYDELMQRAQQDHTDKLAEITRQGVEQEMRIREQLVGHVSDILGSLSTLAEASGKKGFGIAKAFGIAQAVINTAEGITKALAQGGMLGFAGAAAVAAAGAAQIATIARTNPGSSSRPSVNKGSAPAEDTSSGGGDGGAADPTRAIYLSLQGQVYSRESVEELFRQFVDMQKDGYQLIVGN